jgi:hypothetical protein
VLFIRCFAYLSELLGAWYSSAYTLVMIILLLFFQKQSLAFAVHQIKDEIIENGENLELWPNMIFSSEASKSNGRRRR